ncbi:unnamed protein product [Cercospora beticola]|nr:unnamed protein product [Cercospora beticola]
MITSYLSAAKSPAMEYETVRKLVSDYYILKEARLNEAQKASRVLRRLAGLGYLASMSDSANADALPHIARNMRLSGKQ